MRTNVMVACLVFVCWLAFNASASAGSLFGPEIYSRTKGSPDVYSGHFSTSDGNAVVRITSGEEDGGKRVSSALVYLNEKLLARPDDFKKKRYIILEETVAVDRENEIRVEVRGAPGSFLTVEIFRHELSVHIECTPDSIDKGEEALLQWTSSHAETVHIDNGIGDVDLTGSLAVSPETTTTYHVTASGPGGTATDSATLTVISIPLEISITSPGDEDTIHGPAAMVQGAIANPFGNEVGVTVDGITAMVDGDQFVANHIPLDAGQNVITAIATDSEGNEAEASVSVTAVTDENSIGILVNPEIGVSPFETTLTVDGSFHVIDPYVWGTGPGSVVISEGEEENRFNVSLTSPGIYLLTAEAADDQGNLHTGSVSVQVLSQEELDAMLRVKFNEMKSALTAGDVDAAVKSFSGASRSMYHQRFSALSSVLDQVAGDMGPIAFVEADGNRAVYDLTTERDGKVYSYQLVFIREEDGIWRIYNF